MNQPQPPPASQLKPWRIRHSEIVFQNPWRCIRRDHVELPNGTLIDDFYLDVHPDIALTLALTPQQEIVFVRQYRHGAQQILMELPAGRFDVAQEDNLIAAQRELLEETGYKAEQWFPLGTLYDNPVKATNQIHTFIALNATRQQPPQWDVTEEIEVLLLSIEQTQHLLQTGNLCVSGSVAALYQGLAWLREHHYLNQ